LTVNTSGTPSTIFLTSVVIRLIYSISQDFVNTIPTRTKKTLHNTRPFLPTFGYLPVAKGRRKPFSTTVSSIGNFFFDKHYTTNRLLAGHGNHEAAMCLNSQTKLVGWILLANGLLVEREDPCEMSPGAAMH
jgi:hypothetical protein